MTEARINKKIDLIPDEIEYTDRQREIAETARNYFIAGFHCSEAIMKTFNDAYRLNYSKKTIKMATGLGGGMGKAKCSCGCVTTGSIILSSIYGRYDLHMDDSMAFDLARELNERFKKEFKVTCCVALTRKADWGHPNHVSTCSEYVYQASMMLANILDRCIENFGDFRGKEKKAARAASKQQAKPQAKAASKPKAKAQSKAADNKATANSGEAEQKEAATEQKTEATENSKKDI